MQFYRDHLAQASARHCGWAASHYATVSARESAPFWRVRSAGGAVRPETSRQAISARLASGAQMQLSADAQLVEVPLLGSDFVAMGEALRHPALDGPIAYLGGWELAPLLRQVRPGMTPMQVVRHWSPRVPLESGLAIAGWLLSHEILVSHPAAVPAEGRT
jgi:hypothetical protein